MLKPEGRPCGGHPAEHTLLQCEGEVWDIRVAIPCNYNIKEGREIFVC